MPRRKDQPWFLRSLLMVLAVAILWGGTTPGAAAGSHVDAAPHAATEGQQAPHAEGCHAAGICHQVPAVSVDLRVTVGDLNAMRWRPSDMTGPTESGPEFDTPPPRA